jgi:hypothetical protein
VFLLFSFTHYLTIGNKYKPYELEKASFFRNGWSSVEDGFIWTKSDKATIKIQTETPKAVKISLSMRPYTCGGTRTQKVKVVVKEEEIATWDVDKDDDYVVVIPKSSFDSDGILTIILDMPNAISPVDCKTGLDSRKLGVALTGFAMNKVKQANDYKILFNEKGDSDIYTIFGWGHQEANHRWTIGPQAGLQFLLDAPPESDLLFRIKAFSYLARGEIDRQVVDVTANGEQVARWNIQEENWYEAKIPKDLVGEDGGLKIVFDISNPASPAEYGHSSDSRKLGIGVRELVIKETGN